MASEFKEATRLFFVVTTWERWGDEAVEQLAAQFEQLFAGDLSIDEAYLERVEIIKRWICPQCGCDNSPVAGNCLRCGEAAADDVEIDGEEVK